MGAMIEHIMQGSTSKKLSNPQPAFTPIKDLFNIFWSEEQGPSGIVCKCKKDNNFE